MVHNVGSGPGETIEELTDEEETMIDELVRANEEAIQVDDETTLLVRITCH